MIRIINYSSIAASIIGIIAVISAGIKLSCYNYDMVCESIIIGICLMIMFIRAVTMLSKQSEYENFGCGGENNE
jgi:hypothetical protein